MNALEELQDIQKRQNDAIERCEEAMKNYKRHMFAAGFFTASAIYFIILAIYIAVT